jgi:hypothetical protein
MAACRWRNSVLLLDQPPVMLGAKAIDCLATCAGVTLATSRARPPIVAPERVEPLLMLGAVGAVGRELALAMLGILGIYRFLCCSLLKATSVPAMRAS